LLRAYAIFAVVSCRIGMVVVSRGELQADWPAFGRHLKVGAVAAKTRPSFS
jgi:hypothetical protein